MKHVIIIPARNEEAHIATTLESLLAQTLPPDRVYVVNDGSSDDTADIVETIRKKNPSVQLMNKPDRGYRMMGGAVVDTFNFAYEHCKGEEFSYISKIDADVIFPKDYFERLFAFMDANPDVAAASGVLFDHIGDTRQRLRCPDHHIGGPIKTIRKSVFDEMGGFIPVFGWDIIDQVKMRQLGYRTVNLPELEVEHQRQHGTAEGAWHGKATWGRGAWIIGSHPLFVLGRAAYRMLEPPYIIGGFAIVWGYCKSMLSGVPQIEDKSLIKALRREQIYRLLHGNRLPEKTVSPADRNKEALSGDCASHERVKRPPIAKSGDFAGTIKHVPFLGLKIAPLTGQQLIEWVVEAAQEPTPQTCFALNAHSVNMAADNPEYTKALQDCDLVYCDGFGVQKACHILGIPMPARLSTTDYYDPIHRELAARNLSIYIVGYKPGIAEKAAKQFAEQYPALDVKGHHDGYFDFGSEREAALIADIQEKKPHLLWVGMGNPRQELWVVNNLQKLNVPVTLTCGAMMEYATNSLSRAPKWMADNGLEWFYRFLTQGPRVWKRYTLGNAQFIWRVVKAKLKQ